MEAFAVSSKAFLRPYSTLVLFVGSRTLDSAEIEALFVSWASVHVVDPEIIVVGQRSKILEFLQQNARDDKVNGLERLTRHSMLRFAGYDSTGQVLEISSTNNSIVDLTESFRRAVAERIKQEVTDGEIVIPAPPNFWFEKLSGRYASHFIRAESLLQSTATIELLALVLLKPFHDWWTKQRPSLRDRTSIYIDSMGIWPLAEKLTQLHRCDGRNDTEYRIQSFKSYEGIDTWQPVPLPAFVLISASTSGSLEAKVRKRLLPAAAEVHTLIKLKSDDDIATTAGSGIVYELPRKLSGAPSLNNMRNEFVAAATNLPLGDESIQISGERFLSRHAKPRLVRLVYTALSETTRTELATLARNNRLSTGHMKFDGKSRWPITFDDELTRTAITVGDSSGSASLLKDWLKNHAFPGPIAVVYPAQPGSAARGMTSHAKAIAEAAETELRQYPGTDVVTLSSNELLAKSNAEKHQLDTRGFVVICPVIGSGFVFKQIAALLRTIQKSGPRLFLTYIALPESITQFNQLNQDLSRSDASVSYAMLCRYAFPVGRLEQALNWQAELEILTELLDEAQQQNISCPPLLKERVSNLQDGLPLANNNIFLPTLSGAAPKLSSGFALWTGSEDIFGDHLGAAVLLTVAALIEATRTANSKTTATTLGKSLFQQALLDPENFTRYNDGVIQAAIMRAAYPSELDYRSHPGASNDMARLMMKWIQLASHPIGDAAPEFLLAMATGKLRLCPHHERMVLEEAGKTRDSSWLKVLAKISWLRCGHDGADWEAVCNDMSKHEIADGGA